MRLRHPEATPSEDRTEFASLALTKLSTPRKAKAAQDFSFAAFEPAASRRWVMNLD
jgi:hypothetical protein